MTATDPVTAVSSAAADDDHGELSDAELLRYSRQIVLHEVGGRGQLRLRRARVAVVGAGGLGAPALLYLAAAGVGRLTVIDDDEVSLDNLARQVLYATSDVGEAKAVAAARRLRALNDGVEVSARRSRLDASSAVALLSGHDLVLDASDSFATKLATNDACVALGIAAVIGAAIGYEGQVLSVPPRAPCYRCLIGDGPGPDAATSCRSEGVLGPVTGIVGSLQASEALRSLLGVGGRGGELLVLDVLRPRLRSVAVPRDPNCAACSGAGLLAARA